MTFRSLFVQEHPDKVSATSPPDTAARRDAPVFCWLDVDTWPTSALAFAGEHELHIDYVDNCWLLIALDGSMLKRFLSTGATSDPDVAAILERVNDDHWYVINDEEF